jgi:HEAT repeat protein
MLRRTSSSIQDGLALTFDVLTKTPNESAVDVLIAALDDPDQFIQDHALAALLSRRTLKGHREIMSRLPTMNDRGKQLVQINPRFLGRALRENIESKDRAPCDHGCQTVVWLREYDLMPALVHIAETTDHPNSKLAAEYALKLAELLYQDLSDPRPATRARDPQVMRQHVLHTLEKSLTRYNQHKRLEIVEAFLLLVRKDHPVLRKVLSDPIDSAYLPIIDLLTHSHRGGVVRLVLSFLDDVDPPPAAIALMGHRCDEKFIENFLRKIGNRSSLEISTNLKRLDTVVWAQAEPEILSQLDEEAQQGAVQLALCSGISRVTAQKLITYLLRFGKTSARRAAAAALAGIRGTDANQLALAALNDPDPQVQATALGQLRQRGIKGALPMLLSKIDSPDEAVRSAVRRSLEEFNFDRFLSAFDMLDEQVRRSTGAVVKKVDTSTPRKLSEELQARSRTRRMRALQIIDALELVAELQSAVIERLADEDHLVRVEAALALGQVRNLETEQALRDALQDRSIVVREAAQRSLSQWGSLVDASFAQALANEFESESAKDTKPMNLLDLPASNKTAASSEVLQ